MYPLKIVIVGGGSIAFTPRLIDDFIMESELRGSKIVLFDIDKRRLKLMTKYAKERVKQFNSDLKIYSTINRKEALSKADFVLGTIMVGGQKSRIIDRKISMKFGVNQLVGDTAGIGLISRGLRTIPAIIDIVKDMEEVAPQAWFINYTNPMSQVCLAINLLTKIRCVGVCHGVPATIRAISKLLGIDSRKVIYRVAGINHLNWILDFYYKGKNIYNNLREKIKNERKGSEFYINRLLMERFYYFPTPTGNHLSEFFNFFLSNEANYGERYGLNKDNLNYIIQNKSKKVKEIIKQIKENSFKRDLQGSGESATELILCLCGKKEGRHIVNIINDGYIDNIERDAVVEIFAEIGPYGIKGIKIGKIPDEIQPILQIHASIQKLIVEAATRPSYKHALLALMMSSGLNNLEEMELLLKESIMAQKKYLSKELLEQIR